jgi:hypothetical protein
VAPVVSVPDETAANRSNPPERVRDILARRARIPRHVVYREFPAETVVLNLQTEQYHGLNPTAGRMLVAIEQASTIRDAAVQVAGDLRTPLDRVQADIAALCQRLFERGLIEYRDGGDS